MPRLLPHRRLRLTAAVCGWAAVDAAAGAGGNAPTLRRFQMAAYTGGVLALAGWSHPVVVDLAGLRVSAKARPILKDHDSGQIVGHTDAVRKDGGSLMVSGVVSGAGSAAQEVIASSLNGFPWQASIGAMVEKTVFVPEGRTANANGRAFPGPVIIARKSVLGEVSFVALGADDDTSAAIAARGTATSLENLDMDFDAWLSARGFTSATLDEQQLASLKALHAASAIVVADPDEDDDEAEGGDSDEGGDGEGDDEDGDDDTDAELEPALAVATMRAELAAEAKRVRAIRRLCAKHSDIEATAIAKGWDTVRTELAVLRANRPQAPAAHVRDQSLTPAVLEAACFLAAKLGEVEKHCEEQALDAATRRFRGGIGLQELVLEAAWANGYTGRTFRDARAVLQHAMPMGVQAGLSGIDLGGILSNVANKFLVDGFFSVERAWRSIAAVSPVTDFKAITRYRLVGKDQYEKVAPGGEIKHGTLGEISYKNQADTYGLMLSIDRRDLINDDLGAITTVPRKLGRGAGLKLNDVFWSTFLNHAAFFTAANKNLLVGADTALTIDGLTKAEVAFLEQVDPDGKPLGVMPAVILVPPALSAYGTQLFKSVELRETTANAKYPVANPHQGKFRTEVSSYLANPAMAGASAKAWYLLADPADLPLIEVVFLNGQESPVIETADADFSVLGIQMRGYHDFGVSLQEPRGGVKAKGEA